MKTTSVAANSQFSHTPETITDVIYTKNETEEPPGKNFIVKNIEDEPPSSTSAGRYRFFWNVSDASWKDWKWQFRNRITSLEQLINLIPLSVEEQSQIRTVSKRYPLSITPYYLSLINPDDPDDPIKKQSVPCIQEITMNSLGFEDPLAEKEDSVVPAWCTAIPIGL